MAIVVDFTASNHKELPMAYEFINVRTEPGHAQVAPRQTDGVEDKYRFVRYVESLEGITVMGLARQDRQLMKGGHA